jgi:hypothetical protein
MKKPRYYPDIKGSIGSWYAKVRWDDGTAERLSVAHATFSNGKTYHDPLEWGPNGSQRALASAKMQRWVETVKKTKKVVLQKDAFGEDGNFTRIGYVGVYDVDDVTIDATNGLRFKFLDRYQKVQL